MLFRSLLHRPGLEGEAHFLVRQHLAQLAEHRLRDPRLLLRLEPAHLADALAPVLLDDLVLDAREDLHVDDHALHAGRHLEGGRSEEHTSELQSLAYLVCRLLLEKKKKNTGVATQSAVRT